MLASLYTVHRKVREFQYKLMHGAVYFNAQISKRKLIYTTLCTFCSSQVENYDYLLSKCMFTALFWKKIWEFFNSESVLPEVSYKFILFGDFNNIFEGDMYVLFLYGKYYLYACKCKNQLPSISSLIS